MNDFDGRNSGPRQEIVSFHINGQEYGIDIRSVREIRGWTQVQPMPHSPDYVLGVINLRGTVLPIVDLAVRLGLPAQERTTRNAIIVIQAGEQTVGLLVDDVSDLLGFSADAQQATPDIVEARCLTFVPSVLMIEGRMIGMLAIESLLPEQPRKAA